MTDRYSCSFSGECEIDPDGLYTSLEECKVECQGVEAKELQYLIYGYAPEEALALAPSDRVILVKRETGVTVSGYDSYDILFGLGTNNVMILAHYPQLYDYLLQHYDWSELARGLVRIGTLPAFQLLRERGYYFSLGNFLEKGNYDSQLVEFLHDTEPDNLLRSLLYPAADNLRVLTLLLDLYPFDVTVGDLRPPTNPANLDLLVERDYLEEVREWSSSVYLDRSNPQTISWYLQRFPSLRTAENIATAVQHDAWNFVELTASPPLGKEVLEILENQPLYNQYEDSFPITIDLIRRLEMVTDIFQLSREEFVASAQYVWNRYMRSIITNGLASHWIASIVYLQSGNPSWRTREGDLALVEELREYFPSLLRDTFSQLLNLAREEQDPVLLFIKTMNLTPPTCTLLRDGSVFLGYFMPPEEEVLQCLPSIHDHETLSHISELYPNLRDDIVFEDSYDEDYKGSCEEEY